VIFLFKVISVIIITAYSRQREAVGVTRMVYEHLPRHCAGETGGGSIEGGRNVSSK
jgi:hypothetical protein